MKLEFTPMAFHKIIYLRDLGETEIGGFGIAETENPFLVTDFQLVKQECTIASVKFDDESVADFFENMVEKGLKPNQFSRIWIHTHPFDSPHPSFTDENTFRSVFGKFDWSIMFILSVTENTYCRLKFSIEKHQHEIEIFDKINVVTPCSQPDKQSWEKEYYENVKLRKLNKKQKDFIENSERWFDSSYIGY